MRNINLISSGLYLVVDPATELPLLVAKLSSALEAGVAVVQIWENWRGVEDQLAVIGVVCDLCHLHRVPVFINNLWKLAESFPLDGVHFDQVPVDFSEIRAALPEKHFGLTCGNELETVNWAHHQKISYISFCSVFPSTNSNSCELVSFETIRAAREITDLPIILAGGVYPERMELLNGLPHDGVAVISGVMSSESPATAVKHYLKHLIKK